MSLVDSRNSMMDLLMNGRLANSSVVSFWNRDESKLERSIVLSSTEPLNMHALDTTRVAFQGERGAFSEEAAVKLLGNAIELIPRQTFAALFSSLREGVADYLLAPVENSIAGLVQPSVELL